MFTVTDRFQAFLNMSDETLKNCIDMYNHGYMSYESRIALDAVEALGSDPAIDLKGINVDKEFKDSLDAFLDLYKAGFRISNKKSPYSDFENKRFHWKGKILRDMADITRIGDSYMTILNGRAESLT